MSHSVLLTNKRFPISPAQEQKFYLTQMWMEVNTIHKEHLSLYSNTYTREKKAFCGD